MTTPTPVPDAAPLFTVEQANRMLPLVRRIVTDIVTDYRAWRDAVRAYEAQKGSPRGDPARVAALAREVRRLAADVEHYVGELTALGLQCKGLDDGLVDFPGMMDGEPACLCWKLDEPAVAWWHRPEAGFAGRQPIVPNGPDTAHATHAAEAAR